MRVNRFLLIQTNRCDCFRSVNAGILRRLYRSQRVFVTRLYLRAIRTFYGFDLFVLRSLGVAIMGLPRHLSLSSFSRFLMFQVMFLSRLVPRSTML